MFRVLLLLLMFVSQSERLCAQVPDSLDIKIGQMIMIGIDNYKSLSENSRILKDIKEGKVGGVILFEKNIDKNAPKTKLVRLTDSLQKYATGTLFIAIDEEGGRVHRLKTKYGFPSMPSAAHFGRKNNLDTTLYYNRRLAATLNELGINVNFAPTVDLAKNANNTVIVKNNRSFGYDFTVVTNHAFQSIKAHQEYRIVTALKHYPGHGSSTGDTHLGVVDVTNTWGEDELMPYSQLLKRISYDAIMIGHMVNKKWDEELLPATLSKKTIDNLRLGIGFNGVLFSDDMQMQAISNHYGLDSSIRMSINAGLDILVFGNNVPTSNNTHVTASQIHTIIKRMVLDNEISRQKIDDAYTRIVNLKNKRFK